MKRKNLLIASLVVLLCAQVLWAAIAFDVATTSTDNKAANAITYSVTVANVANRVVVFFAYASDASESVTAESLSTAPTYNGSAGTVIGSDVTSSTTYKVSDGKYYLINPSTGANNSVFTYNAHATYHAVVTASVNGADQATPIRDHNRAILNDASGTSSPSVTCASAASGDLMLLVLAQFTSNSAYSTVNTPPSGSTLQATSGALNGVQLKLYTATASGSYTATWSLSAARDYYADCVAIAPASATTTPFVGSSGMLGVGK